MFGQNWVSNSWVIADLDICRQDICNHEFKRLQQGLVIMIKQDLVFTVKLQFGLTLYPLSLIPYPYPCSLSPSTVPFKKLDRNDQR